MALALAPLGTALTYQGRLQDGGAPVMGAVTVLDVTINQWLFAVEVDFGVNAFDDGINTMQMLGGASGSVGSLSLFDLTTGQGTAGVDGAAFSNAGGRLFTRAGERPRLAAPRQIRRQARLTRVNRDRNVKASRVGPKTVRPRSATVIRGVAQPG